MDAEVFAPTFEPTWEEFNDFQKYMESIESQCTPYGICKIVPPAEWFELKKINKNIDDMLIPTPIIQIVSGNKGAYQLMLMERAKMTVKKFSEFAEKSKMPKSSKYQENDSVERIFWKNLKFNPPIYGADMAGSLFKESVKHWNVGHLPSILNVLGAHQNLPGITSPYLYFGMWKAMFAWHVEDMNLFSINYLHFGDPKSWYCVAPEYGPKLERLAQAHFPEQHKQCPEFLRHKTTLISPSVLQQHDIPYSRVVQKEGEFVVTFPYAYHAGFNHGFNCAESVNFALESWIPYGKKAKSCRCESDTVSINMEIFEQMYNEWKQNPVDLSFSQLPTTTTTTTTTLAPSPAKRKMGVPGTAAASDSQEEKKRQKTDTDHDQDIDIMGVDDDINNDHHNNHHNGSPPSSHNNSKSPVRKRTTEETQILTDMLNKYHGMPPREVREDLARQMDWTKEGVYNWYRRRAGTLRSAANANHNHNNNTIVDQQSVITQSSQHDHHSSTLSSSNESASSVIDKEEIPQQPQQQPQQHIPLTLRRRDRTDVSPNSSSSSPPSSKPSSSNSSPVTNTKQQQQRSSPSKKTFPPERKPTHSYNMRSHPIQEPNKDSNSVSHQQHLSTMPVY